MNTKDELLMEIEFSSKNDFYIIRLKNDLRFDANITELKDIVAVKIEEGHANIAISLTPDSHLSSMSIGTVLQCFKLVNDTGGQFALIHPNDEDQDLLDTLGFSCMIAIHDSEESLQQS